MPRPPRIIARVVEAIGPRDALLCVWFFLHVWLFVEPHLIYQASSPAFLMTWGFLAELLPYSGGPVDYVSRFVAQFYLTDWLGALILTLQLWLIGALTHACFREIAGRVDASDAAKMGASDAPKPVRFVRFIPMVTFAVLCGQYGNHLTTGPSLIAILACLLLYTRTRRARMTTRFVLYALLTAALYYGVTGVGGKAVTLVQLTLFMGCALLATLPPGTPIRKATPWAAAYFAVPAALVLFGGQYFLPQRFDAWLDWFYSAKPLGPVLTLWLYLSIPLAAVAIRSGASAWVARVATGRTQSRATRGRRQAPAPSERDRKLIRLLETAASVWLVSVVCVYATADTMGKRAQEMHYQVMHGDWEGVIRTAYAIPAEAYTFMTSYDVNTALFHSGRLAEEMFSFPQVGTRAMLPNEEPAPYPYLYRLAEMYLQLGRVGDAEHVASEEFSGYGPKPFVLRQLATVHMVKGQLPAARIFLNVLRHDLHHGGWARKQLELLGRDPELTTDPEIQRLRQVMLREDDANEVLTWTEATHEGQDPKVRTHYDAMLLSLLRQNPRNRMAFEFLMGNYLLRGELGKVAANIHRLDAFGMPGIPRSYEEALVLYLNTSPAGIDLGQRAIRPETLERYERIREAVRRCGGDVRAAQSQADDDDANSYLFFYVLGKGLPQ